MKYSNCVADIEISLGKSGGEMRWYFKPKIFQLYCWRWNIVKSITQYSNCVADVEILSGKSDAAATGCRVNPRGNQLLASIAFCCWRLPCQTKDKQYAIRTLSLMLSFRSDSPSVMSMSIRYPIMANMNFPFSLRLTNWDDPIFEEVNKWENPIFFEVNQWDNPIFLQVHKWGIPFFSRG